MNLILALQMAGLLHLGLVWAGLTMPRVVGLREHLAHLPGFIRRLFWVYYSFIGMVLVGFGALTFFHAETLANGEPLSRSVCALMGIFWLARLIVAALVFDVRPYLISHLHRLGYHATNLVFLFLTGLYAFVAMKGAF